MRRPQARGFTLVELLVVIGIIALLISILLPALNSARRSANAVKCSAALKEIGNCFAFYSQENRGYYPPTKTIATYRITFGTVDYTAAQYWPNFLAKYVTKTKIGMNGNAATVTGGSATSADEANQARKSVFWGCPSWEPPPITSTTTGLGGTSVVQTGYGMNAFPEYTAEYPPVAAPPNVLGDYDLDTTKDYHAVATPNTANNWVTIAKVDGTGGYGKWYKANAWTRPAERALVADSRYWLLEVQAAPLDRTIPGQFYNSITAIFATPTTDGQTTYDFYRHGKYPTLGANQRFASNGGKAAFNVLFADGHVSTLTDRAEGYLAGRMRYPG